MKCDLCYNLYICTVINYLVWLRIYIQEFHTFSVNSCTYCNLVNGVKQAITLFHDTVHEMHFPAYYDTCFFTVIFCDFILFVQPDIIFLLFLAFQSMNNCSPCKVFFFYFSSYAFQKSLNVRVNMNQG